MFKEQFDAIDEGREPMETFYDGYVVNAIIDACYKSAKSKQWETVQLDDWRGKSEEESKEELQKEEDENFIQIKVEKMPNGQTNLYQ